MQRLLYSALATALAALAGLAAGCSSAATRHVVSLDRFQRFHVETRLNENHRLDELIAAELRGRGRQVSTGPRTMLPPGTEVVVTYDARWAWDFKTYLIELNVEFHTVSPPRKLADGRRYQPSLTPRPPAEVVRGLLDPLFQP